MHQPTAIRLMHRVARFAAGALLACGLLAACVAPTTTTPRAGSEQAGTPAPTAAGSPVAQTPPSAATPATTPAAPRGGTAPAQPVKVDASCRTSADCTVKNVGNCCGYYPACVNAGSATDPQGVQAECARSGRMSVCGFRDITACQCVKEQCEPAAGGLEVQ